MDDTRTLSFDLTDYVEHLDNNDRIVDEVDALQDARGVVRGLAMVLSGWALIVWIAMLAM